MSVVLQQSAHYDGNDWWEWAVWLEAAPQELEAIDRVVYTLHPTFPEPVRTMTNRNEGFRLESAGWGEFEIYIEIVRKNGERQQLTHTLSLEYASEKVASPEPAGKPAPPPRPPLSEAAAPGPSKLAVAPHPPAPSEAARPRTPASVFAPEAAPPAPPVRLDVKRPTPSLPRRTVYLSGGAADAGFTHQLTERLLGGGLMVTSADTMTPGMPWEECYKTGIRSADAAVFVMSGKPTLFSKMEMEFAQGAGNTRVIPVLVGKNASMPASMTNVAAVKVESASEVDAVANQILSATGMR